jgi:cephalosporin hydroxylase
MGKGRAIGVDIDIRAHNRSAIMAHRLAEHITLIEGSSVIEGSSIDPVTVARVGATIKNDDSVMIVLDSNHRQKHVAAELEAYAPMVTPGSYIVVCDGIMAQVTGAPRTEPDWKWNNPLTAIDEFLPRHPEFIHEEPVLPFSESMVRSRVTYWPRAFLRRLA